MILWTIQTEEAWRRLNEDGHLSNKISNVDKNFWQSYRWMMSQMKDRKGPPPRETNFPIWAWYQWNGFKKKKPDLRSSGFLAKNQKGVRIEFECPEEDVLLSDFELWHYVLNYWNLPESVVKGEKFEAELSRNGLCFYKTKPLPDPKYHQKIVSSWDKIFDLDWCELDLALPRKEKSIQAIIWQLNLDQVRRVNHFKSR